MLSILIEEIEGIESKFCSKSNILKPAVVSLMTITLTLDFLGNHRNS